MNVACRNLSDIILEILFEFVALRILMIDKGAPHRCLIGTGLIGKRNHPPSAQKRRSRRGKCHNRRKRGMSVQIPLPVQLQHIGIQCPPCPAVILRVVEDLNHFIDGAVIIDMIGHDVLTAQRLQRHNRILAASHRNQKALVLRRILKRLPHALFLRRRTLDRKKLFLGNLDSIAVHELSEAVVVKLPPPCSLLPCKCSALDADLLRAGNLVIADRLGKSQLEDQLLQNLLRLRIKLPAHRKGPGRMELRKARRFKIIDHPAQLLLRMLSAKVRSDGVVVTAIDKLGILLPVFFKFRHCTSPVV